MTVRIALDAMGGDHAPRVVVEACVQVASRCPDVHFTLVGREDVVGAELARLHVAPGPMLAVLHADEVVGMDEKPSVALRTKKNSSMRVGANLVRDGGCDAFVSAGNTGALMATAKFVLKTLPGIDRPAIASWLPSMTRQTLMLDLGANVDCTPDHLVQFALMGRVFASVVLGVSDPRIGMLNIGEEEMKGNESVRQAGERLRGLFPQFIGNVEGSDIFLGDVDVVVCDGFVGNVSLKTAEGVAQMMSQLLRDAFRHSWLTRLGYLFAIPGLRRFRDRMDPRKYNGAMLLGLNGIVVKSHGGADMLAYGNAIQTAIHLASSHVNDRIRAEVARMVAAVPAVSPTQQS
jgi:glycerol-3-phosphate acyltransferase PlsX